MSGVRAGLTLSPVRLRVLAAGCVIAAASALSSCGGESPDHAGGIADDVPAAAPPGAPPAGSPLVAAEVTQLVPGPDTSTMTLRGPYEGDQDATADGERYFNAFNCSGCHAPLGGGGMGPPLSDTLWVYGGDPENIYLSIMQGRPNGMPSWNMLPPDVIWKIVAYIRTLPEVKSRVSTGQ